MAIEATASASWRTWRRVSSASTTRSNSWLNSWISESTLYDYSSPHTSRHTVPTVSSLGGFGLSSHTIAPFLIPPLLFNAHDCQLLGCDSESYQTFWKVATLSLSIHSPSAIIDRIFSPRILRPLTSALSGTGHALCFLPVRFIFQFRLFKFLNTIDNSLTALRPRTRRHQPRPSPPLVLYHEYVKAVASGWPRRSRVLYSVLVLSVSPYAVDGIEIIWSTWASCLRMLWRRAKRMLDRRAVQ